MLQRPETMRHAFGRGVDRRSRAAGLSAVELADAVNIPRDRIARILRGDALRLTLREMFAIADALNAAVADLFVS